MGELGGPVLVFRCLNPGLFLAQGLGQLFGTVLQLSLQILHVGSRCSDDLFALLRDLAPCIALIGGELHCVARLREQELQFFGPSRAALVGLPGVGGRRPRELPLQRRHFGLGLLQQPLLLLQHQRGFDLGFGLGCPRGIGRRNGRLERPMCRQPPAQLIHLDPACLQELHRGSFFRQSFCAMSLQACNFVPRLGLQLLHLVDLQGHVLAPQARLLHLAGRLGERTRHLHVPLRQRGLELGDLPQRVVSSVCRIRSLRTPGARRELPLRGGPPLGRAQGRRCLRKVPLRSSGGIGQLAGPPRAPGSRHARRRRGEATGERKKRRGRDDICEPFA
mmetsp:Transcript_98980/g.317398  ORF Transcript_98980/g.317398 Transcript_98980/m.317398 type:complete len:334 (-) Transcript_98980:1936-2937(-)